MDQESPESSYSTDYDKPGLNLTSQSFRMSFGTSNGSDGESDTELFITAKSALEQSSCCSDSGVNVSDGSSYRPADHESFEEQDEDLTIPVFNITSPTTDPEHSIRGSSENERQPPSGSECSTPRKLSVASHGNPLHEMSWDNFDIGRNDFETDEEYDKYLAHVKAQAELKHKNVELIGDYSAVSDSETVEINNDHSINDTADSQDITILQNSMSAHNEMSDKDNLYDTSVEDSDISFPTEADFPTDIDFAVDQIETDISFPVDQIETDISFPADQIETDISFPADQIEDDMKSPREDGVTEADGLPMTESLALLAETKKLYSALEEKTSLLEEKYFSPEKMKCALSDPMGSFVLEEQEEPGHEQKEDSVCDDRPVYELQQQFVEELQQQFVSEVRKPVDDGQQKQISNDIAKPDDTDPSEEVSEQKAGLISRSIEFFEQCAQSSSTDSSPTKPNERLMKGTPPKTPSKAQKLKKTRRPSRPRSTDDTSSQASDRSLKRDPLIQSSSIDEDVDIPEVIAGTLAPAAKRPKSPPKLLPKPKSPSVKSKSPIDSGTDSMDCKVAVDGDRNPTVPSPDFSNEGLTKQRLDAIVPCKITRRPHHKSGTSLSQPSIETGTTEISRTTASTNSTAILRESVDNLRFEIDELVNDCGESFATSLDTDRHCFSDSTYNQSLQNNSNVYDDTLVSDSGEILSSESDFSNPVILDEYCSDPEAAASELEELFQSYLPGQPENRGTVGIEVTYHSDKSDSEDIHYEECEISESPFDENTHFIEPEEVPDVNSVLILYNSNLQEPHHLQNHVIEVASTLSDTKSESLQLVECLSITSVDEVIPVIEMTDVIQVDCLQTDVLSDCQSVSSASKYMMDEGVVSDVESVPDWLASDTEEFTDILSQDMSSPLGVQVDKGAASSSVCLNGYEGSTDNEQDSKDYIDVSDPFDNTFVIEELSLSALSETKPEPKSDQMKTSDVTTCEEDSWSPSESSESIRKPLVRKPSIVDDLMDRYLSPPDELDLKLEIKEHVPGCENFPEDQEPEDTVANDEPILEQSQENKVLEEFSQTGDVEIKLNRPNRADSDDMESFYDDDFHDDPSETAGHGDTKFPNFPSVEIESESDYHGDINIRYNSLDVVQHPCCPSTEPETETDTCTGDLHTPQPTEHETESDSESELDSPDPRYRSPHSRPDNSYGAAYDDLETSESETSESEVSEYETLNGNYRHLCSRLDKLRTTFKKDKFNRILDLEQDEATGLTLYEIKLPCITEEDDCEELPSDQINKMMPHVSI